jgi:dolichol-phosphate mannosyltransferase
MRIAVVTPTYNEAGSIGALVERVFALHPDARMLVADDDSPDGTGAIVERLRARFPGLALLGRARKTGYASAYREACRRVLAGVPALDVVVTMDADLSHPPEAIAAMLGEIKRHDIVIGSRYVAGGATRDWEWRRRLISRNASRYVRIVTGVPVRDFTSGFVCYRAETLRRLLANETGSAGYAALIEMKLAAVRLGARIAEIPIVYRSRRTGTSKFSGRIAWEGIVAPWRFASRRRHALQAPKRA